MAGRRKILPAMHEKGLEVYFRDINRYDLIDRDAEVELEPLVAVGPWLHRDRRVAVRVLRRRVEQLGAVDRFRRQVLRKRLDQIGVHLGRGGHVGCAADPAAGQRAEAFPRISGQPGVDDAVCDDATDHDADRYGRGDY